MHFYFTDGNRERIDLDQVETYYRSEQTIPRNMFAFKCDTRYYITFVLKSGDYQSWRFEVEEERDRIFEKLETRMSPIKL